MPNVLITGASTGIGRSCALDLCRRGWGVLAGVRREVDGKDLLLQREGGWPGKLLPVQLDVTKADDLKEAAKIAIDFCGESGLQGLVNNAGIVVAGPLEFLPMFGFRNQLEVNTIGALAATQAFLPLLRMAAKRQNNPSGKSDESIVIKAPPRIIMMSSISGRVGTPLVGAYNASKFAMEGMSDALRRELRSHGIDVVLVEPGAIATPIWKKSSESAARLEPSFPPVSHEVYGPFIAAMKRKLPKVEARAIQAERVSKVVSNALSNKRARTRYLVGNDAKIAALLQKILPTRLFDRIISWDALK